MSPRANTWRRLQRAAVKEDTLQGAFMRWPDRAHAQMFGVPDWLDRIKVQPEGQKSRVSFGYAFAPDIEFIDAGLRYVIELKYGVKYEPLALAEVLHHAAWLRRYEASEASHVVPVVVSQFNSWLRLAIDEYLRGQVRLIEIEVLEPEAPPGRSGPHCFVFDAPLAPWSPREAPDWLVQLAAGYAASASLRWHFVAETGSWFGMRHTHRSRPTFIDEPYIWLHRHDDGTALVWEGLAPELHERAAPARPPSALTASGTYHLCTSQPTATGSAGPTWLDGV